LVPATGLSLRRRHAASPQLVISDSAPALGPNGAAMTAGTYLQTEVCDQGIADKRGIPAAAARAAAGPARKSAGLQV
jgi:hypothetical protein